MSSVRTIHSYMLSQSQAFKRGNKKKEVNHIRMGIPAYNNKPLSRLPSTVEWKRISNTITEQITAQYCQKVEIVEQVQKKKKTGESELIKERKQRLYLHLHYT